MQIVKHMLEGKYKLKNLIVFVAKLFTLFDTSNNYINCLDFLFGLIYVSQSNFSHINIRQKTVKNLQANIIFNFFFISGNF